MEKGCPLIMWSLTCFRELTMNGEVRKSHCRHETQRKKSHSSTGHVVPDVLCNQWLLGILILRNIILCYSIFNICLVWNLNCKCQTSVSDPLRSNNEHLFFSKPWLIFLSNFTQLWDCFLTLPIMLIKYNQTTHSRP